MNYNDHLLDNLQSQIDAHHAELGARLYDVEKNILEKIMPDINLFDEVVGQAQADIEELYHNLGYTESRLKIVEAKLDALINKPRPVSSAKTEIPKQKTDLENCKENTLNIFFNINSDYNAKMKELGVE